MKRVMQLAVFGLLSAIPSAVYAQEAGSEFFVGASVGYHDLGVSGEAEDFGIDVDDSGLIYGVVAGVDFPIGETVFAGVEGNFHLGSGAIDSEYGASARFGFVGSNGGKFYVRGGYQEVDIDVSEIIGEPVDEDGFDTSEGDYLVGLGADLPIGGAKLRLNVDTIAFDSLRGTAGLVFAF